MFWKLLIPFAAALLLTVLCGHFMLPVLIRLKVGQSIRSDGPQRHLSKAGTPTMGGLIFIPVLVLLCLFLPDKQYPLGLWLFSFLAFGLIGFLDDWAKLRHHENLGLNGKQKLLGQFVAVAILLAGNAFFDPNPTAIYLFGTEPLLDLDWCYYPLMAILMVGMVNAVNLTDGLDGLVSGVSVPVFFGFQGGKSLAAFGGLVLAHDPLQFAVLLTLGIVMAFVLNYGVYLAVTATALFPFFSYIRSGSIPVFLSTGAASGIVFALHWTNLRRAITGEDPIHTRDGFKKIFGKKV